VDKVFEEKKGAIHLRKWEQAAEEWIVVYSEIMPLDNISPA
jgi:hypothetical protein